jgi:hypothetical protein
MERIISRIDDVTMVEAIVNFANTLGLSVSPNIDQAGEGNFLTTGSKKYNLNWIRNESFAEDKNDGNIIWSLSGSEDYIDIIKALVEEYVDNKEDEDDDFDGAEDEVSLVETPSNDVIINLYDKVKAQKKAPRNYVVVLKNGNWVASTTATNGVGNLADLYNNI